MSSENAKHALFEAIAVMGKAFASPRRLELLDLLAQERQERSPLISISQAIETVGRNQTGHFNEVGLTAPCSGSVGSGLTMSLSIVFTATF